MFVQDFWGLPEPSTMFSITGSARDFPPEIEQRLKALFLRAIARVAGEIGAWVIDGGTEAGIMKIAGRAFRDRGRPVVQLGIVYRPKIHLEESFVAGSNVVYGGHPHHDHAALEPNHTHFIMVPQLPKEGHGWGGDSVFTGRFHKELMLDLPRKAVLIIAGGGVNTTRVARDWIEASLVSVTMGKPRPAKLYKTPFTDRVAVVLEGSGGFADDLAIMHRLYAGVHDKYRFIMEKYNTTRPKFLEAQAKVDRLRKEVGALADSLAQRDSSSSSHHQHRSSSTNNINTGGNPHGGGAGGGGGGGGSGNPRLGASETASLVPKDKEGSKTKKSTATKEVPMKVYALTPASTQAEDVQGKLQKLRGELSAAEAAFAKIDTEISGTAQMCADAYRNAKKCFEAMEALIAACAEQEVILSSYYNVKKHPETTSRSMERRPIETLHEALYIARLASRAIMEKRITNDDEEGITHMEKFSVLILGLDSDVLLERLDTFCDAIGFPKREGTRLNVYLPSNLGDVELLKWHEAYHTTVRNLVVCVAVASHERVTFLKELEHLLCNQSIAGHRQTHHPIPYDQLQLIYFLHIYIIVLGVDIIF